jgi:hypothetical protein
MYMSYTYKFRANYLATEGYYLFSYIINKPYTKLLTHSLGVLTAFAFFEYLSYKKVTVPEVKRGRHPIIHMLASK